jgi:hypothetical protein
VEVEHGHSGIGGHGKANQFRLTYVNDKHCVEPSHEWKCITTIEDAERIAAKARAEIDPRAQKLGARGGAARKEKFRLHFVTQTSLTKCS